MEKSGPRRRVLIVDDQEPMRLLLAHLIQQDLDAEVTLAGTCEAALRLVRESAFDVILLDLMMPGIGGIEVLKHIRTDSANEATPVVIVSVLVNAPVEGERMSARRAKELGANAVVSKPVDRGDLIAAVKAQLGA
jgi:two-component system phosphate regulon response regulator PhoB